MFCEKSCTYNRKYTIIILFQFIILTYYFSIRFHKSRFYFHYLISSAAYSTVQVYFKNFSRWETRRRWLLVAKSHRGRVGPMCACRGQGAAKDTVADQTFRGPL